MLLNIKNKILFLIKIVFSFFNRDYIKYLCIFSFFITIFSIFFISNSLPITYDDPFFHIKFAEIIRQGDFFEPFYNFESLPFSEITSGNYFVYYNFLFYFILSFFTYTDPLYTGLNFFSFLFFSLILTIVYFFLKKNETKYPFFLTITFFAILHYSVLSRFFIARPFVFASALLLLLLFFLHKKNISVSFLIVVFYIFWHPATFFLPIFMAIVLYFFEEIFTDRRDWKVLFYTFLATFLSIVLIYLISPGFLFHFKALVVDLVSNGFLKNSVSAIEGMEMTPMNFIDFFYVNSFMMSLFSICVVIEIGFYAQLKSTGESLFKNKNRNIIRMSLFFIAISFLAGSLINGRFIDFFVFFATIYIMISGDDFVSQIYFKDVLIKKNIIKAVLIVILYLFISNIVIAYNNFNIYSNTMLGLPNSAVWLKENTEKGEVVFNGDWGWFPMLFYYSPNNKYIAGITPKFLFEYDERMYWLWRNINEKGIICEKDWCDTSNDSKPFSGIVRKMEIDKTGKNIALVIKNVFKSRFVLVRFGTNDNLINVLSNDKVNFSLVFQDRPFLIYKVLLK